MLLKDQSWQNQEKEEKVKEYRDLAKNVKYITIKAKEIIQRRKREGAASKEKRPRLIANVNTCTSDLQNRYFA